MWRKIYNAIWADKAKRTAVLTILIALIVSGIALALVSVIGKNKPVQSTPGEQTQLEAEVSPLPQESGQIAGSEKETGQIEENGQTEQSGEQYEKPDETELAAQETSQGTSVKDSSQAANDTQSATAGEENTSDVTESVPRESFPWENPPQ